MGFKYLRVANERLYQKAANSIVFWHDPVLDKWIEAFQASGLNVEEALVIGRKFSGEGVEEVIDCRVRALTVPPVFPWYLIAIPLRATITEADIMHVFSSSATAGLACVLPHRSKICVYHMVGEPGETLRVKFGLLGKLFALVAESLVRLALKGADFRVFVSEALRRKYGSSDDFVIADAKFLSMDMLEHKSEYSPHSPVRVLYVGRLSPEKNVDMLFAIASREWEFWVIGEGVEGERLKGLAEKRRLNVRWFGWRPREEVWALMREADVLVLPSKTEGLPNAVLEAMAQGLPVVATAVGGVPELLADGRGVLVPPDDPKALREGIERALSSEELRREMAAKAREFALKLALDNAVEPLAKAILKRLEK